MWKPAEDKLNVAIRYVARCQTEEMTILDVWSWGILLSTMCNCFTALT